MKARSNSTEISEKRGKALAREYLRRKGDARSLAAYIETATHAGRDALWAFVAELHRAFNVPRPRRSGYRVYELPPLPKSHPRNTWRVICGNNGRNPITEEQFLHTAAWAYDRLKVPLQRNMAALDLFMAVHKTQKGGAA